MYVCMYVGLQLQVEGLKTTDIIENFSSEKGSQIGSPILFDNKTGIITIDIQFSLNEAEEIIHIYTDNGEFKLLLNLTD